MLRAVTFDLWQTLIADPPDVEAKRTAARLEGMGAALARAGCRIPAEALEAAYRESGVRLETMWRQNRDLPNEAQARMFVELVVGIPLEASLAEEAVATILAMYGDAALEIPPEPLPGAADAVKECYRRGLKVGLVSNTGRTPGRVLRPVLERMGILGAFSALKFSDECGVRKPDPEIFRMALREMGVEPPEAVHVGDSGLADALGARAAGMRVIHIRKPAEAEPVPADGVVNRIEDVPMALERLKSRFL